MTEHEDHKAIRGVILDRDTNEEGIGALNQITVEVGDILEFSGDVIVNPAHSSLLSGSGLSGAIHRSAGPELEQATMHLAPCPEGEVRTTPAFRLKCRWIIHAVGPRWWDGTRHEEELQRRLHQAIAEEALRLGMRDVAIPAIGIGIHRFPVEVAARACCAALIASGSRVRYHIVLPSEELRGTYQSALLQSLLAQGGP